MCNKTKIISRVKYGELSVCMGCETYSLTFNNVFFQFELEEFIQFKNYISKVYTAYWLTHYANTTQKRKIPIQTYHQNLILIFNIYEFEKLKVLLEIKSNLKKEILSPEDVEYMFILN